MQAACAESQIKIWHHGRNTCHHAPLFTSSCHCVLLISLSPLNFTPPYTRGQVYPEFTEGILNRTTGIRNRSLKYGKTHPL